MIFISAIRTSFEIKRVKVSAFNGNFLVARPGATRRLSIDPYHCVTESTRRPNICCCASRPYCNATLIREPALRATNMVNDIQHRLPLILSRSSQVTERTVIMIDIYSCTSVNFFVLLFQPSKLLFASNNKFANINILI